jgi:UDPglucose--hexose-1-phosphate uridylyltransferase
MLPNNLAGRPHRRLNPLTGDWVLVSPHRTQRPWQGQLEKQPSPAPIAYDPACYLCPGNSRAGGERNPAYDSTFVFTNDFAALVPSVQLAKHSEGQLLVAESESGTCRVVCFSPRHDLTLSRMTVPEIDAVVNLWAAQHAQLGAQSSTRYVQIFENRGEIMGCSNPHPHCQIWTNETIPNEPRKEQERQLAYRTAYGSCLMCDYLALEEQDGSRLICENGDFAVVVPFWAVWPFEALLIAKSHLADLPALSSRARTNLADILKRITIRYDNLFQVPFPYSMGFHQSPTDGQSHREWHLHAHFYPPLLRSATVRKFMVGYEMLASPQRDISPEAAAQRLREAGEVHYADNG